jgi:hypothetical protein
MAVNEQRNDLLLIRLSPPPRGPLSPGIDEHFVCIFFNIVQKTGSSQRKLVPPIIYSQLNDEMRQGLLPKDDISEKNSTEFRRDLTFEGLRPKTYGRMHSLHEKCCPLNPQR